MVAITEKQTCHTSNFTVLQQFERYLIISDYRYDVQISLNKTNVGLNNEQSYSKKKLIVCRIFNSVILFQIVAEYSITICQLNDNTSTKDNHKNCVVQCGELFLGKMQRIAFRLMLSSCVCVYAAFVDLRKMV